MALINPSNRQRERLTLTRLQDRISTRFERNIRNIIGRSMNDAADIVARDGVSFIGGAFLGDDIERQLSSAYRQAASDFGKRIVESEKSSGNIIVVKNLEDVQRELDQRLRGFISTWTAAKVVQINKTTQNQVKAIVERSLSEGLSQTEVSAIIKQRAGVLSSVRANAIARTEVHGAAGFGSNEAAKIVEKPLIKEWVAAADDRTRDSEFDHVSADGQTVALDRNFDVSGEALEYPGDFSGSPGNVINCRCQSIYRTER